MDSGILITLINVIIGGIVSGVIVTICNYYLSRRRTDAEIRQMEANTELTRLEIQQLRSQLQEVRTRIIDRVKVDDNHAIVLQEEERTLPGVMRERA